MSKSLLIESGILVSLDQKSLHESVQLVEKKGGRLIVRGVPATKLEFKNANGRKYSKSEMTRALGEAKKLIDNRGALCTADDHPQGTHVAPIRASHLVVNAYIQETKDGPYLMNDWEILETANGKDLRALVDANASFGTSIRGLGNMKGEDVTNYEYLGTDAVGNPSSGTYTTTTEELGLEVRVECVAESTESALQPKTESTLDTPPSRDEYMTEKKNETKAAMEAARGRINALVAEGKSLDEITSAVVKEETALVTQHMVGAEDFASWGEFKTEIFGRAPKTESAPEQRQNLNEAQLRDQLALTERAKQATDLVNADLRSALEESRANGAALIAESQAGEKLLEGALDRLRAVGADHGSKTAAQYREETDAAVADARNAADDAREEERNRVVAETTRIVQEVLDEYKGRTKAMEKRYTVAVQIGEQIKLHFEGMRTIAKALAEQLREVYASKETTSEARSLRDIVSR